MDPWQVAQNYGIAVAVGGAVVYYYLSTQKTKAPKGKQAAQSRRQAQQKDNVVEEPKKPLKQATVKTKGGEKSKPKAAAKADSKKTAPKPAKSAPQVPVEDVTHEDESEMSAKAFAQQMQKAKQGTDLSRPSQQTARVRTVKTGKALASPSLPSGGQDSDAEARAAGDISDMLEPTPSGPTSLRITASEKPQKEKKVQKKEEEKPESKKQRQNRKKKEEARLAREAEDQERKVLMESQRRTAREARGEPAKNGIPVAPAPVKNPWAEQNAAREAQVQTAPVVNGSAAPPLLDTFDAESTGSSTGGLEASTAATSTYEQDAPSEEDQLVAAVRQTEDESGWNTVAKPKGKKKKTTTDDDSGAATPVEQAKPVKAPAPAPAPAAQKFTSGEKPKGFQALTDEYVQRSDVDPSDASNWDA
ncbi:hypothetical protein K431DRAFT_293293 [Polychaeton citri CBS 116435]|uniref:Uncharacterized protein n=1 Tax=Polychaeton citri CBS 116435 TaxID=1314669 RepID=A0A9P4QBG5_9PEZI|nr:hypothetical protein K431DRAFT_293293 [Polychaeton citri CBS 116435]